MVIQGMSIVYQLWGFTKMRCKSIAESKMAVGGLVVGVVVVGCVCWGFGGVLFWCVWFLLGFGFWLGWLGLVWFGGVWWVVWVGGLCCVVGGLWFGGCWVWGPLPFWFLMVGRWAEEFYYATGKSIS